MKHKIKLLNYSNHDTFGTAIFVNGKELFCDGEYTYNCLEQILKELGIDCEIEYESEYEVSTFVTKKLKLVEDNNENS